VDTRHLRILVHPIRNARGRPGRPDQQHAGISVIGQVLAEHLIAERGIKVLGARMRVHVDQARQQPTARDDDIRVRDRLGP
jgi:hypothetical protein